MCREHVMATTDTWTWMASNLDVCFVQAVTAIWAWLLAARVLPWLLAARVSCTTIAAKTKSNSDHTWIPLSHMNTTCCTPTYHPGSELHAFDLAAAAAGLVGCHFRAKKDGCSFCSLITIAAKDCLVCVWLPASVGAYPRMPGEPGTTCHQPPHHGVIHPQSCQCIGPGDKQGQSNDRGSTEHHCDRHHPQQVQGATCSTWCCRPWRCTYHSALCCQGMYRQINKLCGATPPMPFALMTNQVKSGSITRAGQQQPQGRH